MALFCPGLSRFGFQFSNWDANPSGTPGSLVTAGASPNTESATPLVLATGAQLTTDIYATELHVLAANGTGDRQILMDFGWDPAGGTSYTWVVNNIVVGNAGLATNGGGFKFVLPLYIPSGSQVAVRIQSSQASIAVDVCAVFHGQPSNPEAVPVGSFSETIGTITNSNGPSFTPGNAADGAYADLGVTAKDMWWWQLAYSIANGTITAEQTYIELAWGDASNKSLIHRLMHVGTTAETCTTVLNSNTNMWAAYCPVPAGHNLYVRGRCVNAPDTGYNAVAIGIGG